ncbi:DUF4124 domain-containing protein [Rubrivivax rivuli]|uniref:DUF4124 domain-containing protein n=1 Tax=Rubrivivax rivuli TaxID=1862385 RepID=A0A437REZ6_9BURK|nr:DUF4124 domain-containing protein [Rubrivivax rivuli]RVU45340.1 DUF4124 domain-containing protein [Rubrivivax rivuli]
MKILPVVLALAACSAHAQFKCTGKDGAVSFQDAPCAGQERAEKLALPAAAPTPARPPHILRAIAEKKIVPGMTRAELDRMIGGPPDRFTRSMSAEVVRHQLVYASSRRTLYVYTEDGVVVSTQEVER